MLKATSLNDHEGMANLKANIISVKEARKILGRDALHLSDEDLAELIVVMTKIASNFFDSLLVPNTSKVY